MAVVQNPIIGRARNKMGGVIFQTWKGKNVLRSKPLTVANPRTDAQTVQRDKMTLAVEVYRSTSGAVKAGFVQQASGQSEYNAFVSHSMKNAMTVAGTVVTLDFNSLKFSKGTISVQSGLTAAEGSSSGDILVTWDSSTLAPGQSASDKLVMVAYNSTQEIWEVFFTGVARSADTATVSLSVTPVTLDIIYVYSFFVNGAGNKTSDSQNYGFAAS